MPSAKVSLNGKIIAESNDTVIVEGNHYFRPDFVNMEYFTENDRHTVCHWKGVANYFDINVDGEQPGSTLSHRTPRTGSRTMSPSTATRSRSKARRGSPCTHVASLGQPDNNRS
jgi:hypothetical protein